MPQFVEYQVLVYKEPLLGSLFLGESKVDAKRFASFLNEQAAQGWRVKTMERENRRALLFFNHEAFLVIMERDRS